MAKKLDTPGNNLATFAIILFSVIFAVQTAPQVSHKCFAKNITKIEIFISCCFALQSKGVHQYMNRRELLRYFGTKKHEEGRVKSREKTRVLRR